MGASPGAPSAFSPELQTGVRLNWLQLLASPLYMEESAQSFTHSFGWSVHYFDAGPLSKAFSLLCAGILVRNGKNGVISNGIFSFAETRATGFAFAIST